MNARNWCKMSAFSHIEEYHRYGEIFKKLFSLDKLNTIRLIHSDKDHLWTNFSLASFHFLPTFSVSHHGDKYPPSYLIAVSHYVLCLL